MSIVSTTHFPTSVTSAWSPTSPSRLATGTLDGGSGISFVEEEAVLMVSDVHVSRGLVEIHKTKVQGGKFASLAWGGSVLAGGMTDGNVRLWNAELTETGVISKQHATNAPIRALHFNPSMVQLLAHGGADKRVCVSDVSRPDAPVTFTATENSTQHSADVNCVVWNSETAHILASASMDGVCAVWDTRSKKSFCEIRDPRGASTTVVSWNPKAGFHLITGSDSGLLRLFDLRSSKTTPLAELQNHTSGVFDVSWCPFEPGYLVSCGKDNRLLLWDLYSAQIVCELSEAASAPATTVVGGGGPSSQQPGSTGGLAPNPIGGFAAPSSLLGSSGAPGGRRLSFSADALFSSGDDVHGHNSGPSVGGFSSGGASRRYQVDWSPTVPGLLSACSFDRSVQVISMIGGASINFLHNPNRVSHGLRAPAWLGRKCGASFGFGGRLLTFNSSGADVDLKNVHRIVPEKETQHALRVGERIAAFERDLNQAMSHDHHPDHDHLAAFCAQRSLACTSESDAEIWRFMRVLFAGDRARVEIEKFLGYDEEAVSQQADLSYLPPQANADGSPIPAPPPRRAPKASMNEKEAAVDDAVVRSLIVGNFEAAVAVCFEHDRHADALLIASLGGPVLLGRAQRAYLDKKAPEKKVMQVAESIFYDDVAGSINRADLSQKGAWKQSLALLTTYAKGEEFDAHCDALASRLERETGDLGAATVCYMLARNVEKSIQLWTRINPKSDVDLVEKAVVFQKALSNAALLTNDQCAMQKFASLAGELAEEGEFEISLKYATMAASVDHDASELVSRVQYGLQWTDEAVEQARAAAAQAETEAAAAAAEAAAAEAEYEKQQLQLQQQQHFQQQQQHQQHYPPQENGYHNGGGYAQFAPPLPPAQHAYGAPSSYGAPPYQAPAPAYRAPAPTYQAAPAYQAPAYQAPAYQAPAPAYQAPAPAYQAPAPAYQAPAPVYQAPAPVYQAPAPVYQAPAPVYQAPAYQDPASAYQAPAPAYQAPVALQPFRTQVPGPSSHSQTAYVPPMNLQSATSPLPRIKENDGFGTTAGNPDAGAKYGNYGAAQAIPQDHAQALPLKPAKLADDMIRALNSIDKLLNTLKTRYTSGMEERRLKEAEKGLPVLKSALGMGAIADMFQVKIKELAAAFERGAYHDAHNIQIALSAALDWKEHKDWLKGLGHLIAVAQKDAAPAAPVASLGGGPPALPSILAGGPPRAVGGPSMTAGGPPPSYGGPPPSAGYSAGPPQPSYGGGPPQSSFGGVQGGPPRYR